MLRFLVSDLRTARGHDPIMRSKRDIYSKRLNYIKIRRYPLHSTCLYIVKLQSYVKYRLHGDRFPFFFDVKKLLFP